MSLNDLREALAAAGVAPLIAKQIDLNLLEYQRRYSPLVRVVPSEPWGTNQYFFNTRSARPSGGFVQDGGARPVGTSTYSQNSFNIRNLQTVGAVTGFAQAVTRDVIGDLKSREVDGAIQNLLWDIENAMIWGCEPATYNSTSGTLGQYPQFSGLFQQVNVFSGAGQNAIDEAATSALTLAMLDEVKDLAEENAAMPVQGEQWMWVMGPRAKTKIDQLLVNQQRFEGPIEVAAGLIVNSYAGIPIIKSSFLSPRTQVMATPSIANSQSASNPVGSLAAGARYYRIGSIVQRFGEIAGCVEITTPSARVAPVSSPSPRSSPPTARTARSRCSTPSTRVATGGREVARRRRRLRHHGRRDHHDHRHRDVPAHQLARELGADHGLRRGSDGWDGQRAQHLHGRHLSGAA